MNNSAVGGAATAGAGRAMTDRLSVGGRGGDTERAVTQPEDTTGAGSTAVAASSAESDSAVSRLKTGSASTGRADVGTQPDVGGTVEHAPLSPASQKYRVRRCCSNRRRHTQRRAMTQHYYARSAREYGSRACDETTAALERTPSDSSTSTQRAKPVDCTTLRTRAYCNDVCT